MTAFETSPAAAPTMFAPAADVAGVKSGLDAPISMSERDFDTVLVYLGKARARAERIRENAPAGSYLEKVLARTIGGIDREMAQLRYLLAQRDLPKPAGRAMRPAI